MRTVRDIFTSAMGLMDELDAQGGARHALTEEYERRTPGIVNMMISEYRVMAGLPGSFTGVEQMEDMVLKIDDAYAIGVMHYGLAANLLVDENPAAASFYEQRYEELRNMYFARQRADEGQIGDMYGGIEFGKFGRW